MRLTKMLSFVFISAFLFAFMPFFLSAQEGQEQTEGESGEQNQDRQQSQQEESRQGNTVPSGVDGYVQIQRVGATAWRIVDSGGDGVYARPEMSRVYMEVDGEYYIDVSRVNSEVYPLDIRSRTGDVLMSQRENAETPEIEGVNSSVDQDGVRFTLNENLAQRIAFFRAAPYPEMVGFISPVAADTGEGEGSAGEQSGGEEAQTEG